MFLFWQAYTISTCEILTTHAPVLMVLVTLDDLVIRQMSGWNQRGMKLDDIQDTEHC